MHTKKWLWRLDYWHRVKALLGGWDISPSPYIKTFICMLLMLWPSGSSEQNSTDLWNSASVPKYLHSTYLTPRPVSTAKVIFLYLSERIHLSTTQAELRKKQGSSLLFVFLSSAGAADGCVEHGWDPRGTLRIQGKNLVPEKSMGVLPLTLVGPDFIHKVLTALIDLPALQAAHAEV